MGVAASNIPKNVFVVIDLYGPVEMITITSSCSWDASLLASLQSQSITSELAEAAEIEAEDEYQNTTGFHANHGKNIMISNGGLTAERTESYNQGLIVTSQPLRKNQMFQVPLTHLRKSLDSNPISYLSTVCELSVDEQAGFTLFVVTGIFRLVK